MARPIAFTSAPVMAWTLAPSYMLGVLTMSVLLIARHKNNIKALLNGEEWKFGDKKSDRAETE